MIFYLNIKCYNIFCIFFNFFVIVACMEIVLI